MGFGHTFILLLLRNEKLKGEEKGKLNRERIDPKPKPWLNLELVALEAYEEGGCFLHKHVNGRRQDKLRKNMLDA